MAKIGQLLEERLIKGADAMTRDEIPHILDLYFDALKSGRMEAFPFTRNITFEGAMVVGTI